jgi:formamidopyrimidine-DNA glycosylase
MPELPEVEVIRTELDSKIVNQKIKNITSYWHKTFVNLCPELPNNYKIVDTNRVGKYIILELERNYLVIHLRMTGQLIYNEKDDFSEKHLRTSIQMHSGNYLNFYDARKFGRIHHVADLKSFFTNVGIDALSLDFTSKSFKEMLGNKKRGIKSFLLDQKNIAGLGNIYIDESLFLSGIHPLKLTNEIDNKSSEKLYKNIKKILNLAIENMGTTISDYRTTGGGFGTNQNFLKVYSREDETCFQCNTIINKIRINSRGTHFCPVCQPEDGVLQ